MVIIGLLVVAMVAVGIVAGWIARRPRERLDPGAPLRQQPGFRVLTDPGELIEALDKAIRYDSDTARRMLRHVSRYEDMAGSTLGQSDPGRAAA